MAWHLAIIYGAALAAIAAVWWMTGLAGPLIKALPEMLLELAGIAAVGLLFVLTGADLDFEAVEFVYGLIALCVVLGVAFRSAWREANRRQRRFRPDSEDISGI
jgi:hypothetical protein